MSAKIIDFPVHSAPPVGAAKPEPKPEPTPELQPEDDGSGAWKTPLDMVRELLKDLETGELAMPDMIYVAMRQSSGRNGSMQRFPSYFFSDLGINGRIGLAGLLERHKLGTLIGT